MTLIYNKINLHVMNKYVCFVKGLTTSTLRYRWNKHV